VGSVIFALVRKEFLALLKDKRSRFVIVVPPFVQLLVFSFAASFDLNDVPFAVYNEDRSAASRSLVARFEGSPNFSLARNIRADGGIAPAIDRRDVLMVLHIGPNFSEQLLLGRTAPVQIIIDGRNSNTALIVLNYARAIVTDFNQGWARDHGQAPPPAVVTARAWFNPNLESRWFIVPGIVGLLTLVVSLLVTALSVAREREAGSFDQLLVTPLRPSSILIGKALPGIIIGTIEASLIIAIAVFGFGVPLQGELPALYLGLSLFLLSSIGIGLMISSLAATQQQALLGAFLFMVPAVILSGFATPIANMPQAVQLITYLDPLRYFLVVIRGVFLEGSTMDTLFSQYWPMAVIGLTTLSFAAWLFRNRMY
jgi:ABC-2 type transport system permease protein